MPHGVSAQPARRPPTKAVWPLCQLRQSSAVGEVSPALAAEAQRFLAGQDLVLHPRLQWPQGIPRLRGRIDEQLRVQPGQAPSEVRAGDRSGARAARRRSPTSSRMQSSGCWAAGNGQRPTWITFVPSRQPKLVLAERIAAVGRLPLHQVLGGSGRSAAAGDGQQRLCRNVHGAFAVTGPVHQVECCSSMTRPTPNGPSPSSGPGSARRRRLPAGPPTARRGLRSDCWLPVIPYSYGCTTSLSRRRAWGSHHGKTTTEGNRGNAH